MIDLFFGWITKGQYEISFLDVIFATVEAFALFCIMWVASVVGAKIADIKQKGRKKIDEKEENNKNK